jgi:hypothetical protein
MSCDNLHRLLGDTVEDGPKGIRFRKYREFDRLAADDIAEAAE